MSDSTAPSGIEAQPSGKAPALIGACRSELLQLLKHCLPVALDETRRQLFAKAEKAHSSQQQDDCLTAMKLLDRHGPAFLAAIEPAVVRFFTEAFATPRPHCAVDPEASLSLLADDELEQSPAIGDFAGKAESRYLQEIHGLSSRLTVLNGGRAITTQDNPLGPVQIGRAVAVAAAKLPLEVEPKVVLYQAIDRVLLRNLGACYRRLNELLIEAGILPNLRYQVHRPEGGTAQPSSTAPGAAAAQAPQNPHPAVPPPSAGLGQAAQDVGDELHQESGELLSRLHALMQRMPRTRSTGGVRAETAQLDASLRQLQGQFDPRRGEILTLESVRKRLERSLSEQHLSMDERQANAIDLVGMVQDYIRDDLAVAAPVRGLLEQLQVPLMRVAVADPSFFEDRRHPARRFLDAVADAGEHWVGDRPEQSQTLVRMRQAVDRLKQQPSDLSLFSGLLADLQRHIDAMRRKAQLAEQRQVAALKGMERLAQARGEAQRAIAEVLKRQSPPRFARELLECAWSDYLALLHLRHGDDGALWTDGQEAARFLAMSLSGNLSPALAATMRRRLPHFRSVLATGLGQVGYSEQDVGCLVGRIESAIRWSLNQEGEQVMTEALDAPLSSVVVEVARPAVAAATPPTPPEATLSEPERQCLARLRLTAFGTWFDIQPVEQGPCIRRKLSWYSPVSGRCLLVDYQGRPEDLSFSDLARLDAAGRARRLEGRQQPLLDRALHAVFQRLNRLAGNTGRPTGPAIGPLTGH